MRRFCLALFVIALAVFRADAESPWSVTKDASSASCWADGPKSGDASLTFLVMGSQFYLLLSPDDFHIPKGTYPTSIQLDDGAALPYEVMSDGQSYAMIVSPKLGLPMRAASKLVITVSGKSYAFVVNGMAKAMDDAARCAGTTPMLGRLSDSSTAISGAGEWRLLHTVADKCAARRPGDDLDVMISLNDAGRLILMAGRPGWMRVPGNIDGTLQIDEDPPQQFSGNTFDNLVFYLVKDDAVAERLRNATSLKWRLPWGNFRADVTGLGVAQDAVRVCDLSSAGRK